MPKQYNYERIHAVFAFTSILMIAAAASADAARPLPISEARKISETGARYEIEGEVVSVSRYWSAVRDDSGAMRVRNWTKPWSVGDVVRMTVNVEEPSSDSPGYVKQIAIRSRTIGRRAAKPPREVSADAVSRGRIAPFSPVVLRGTVTSAFPDEIDASWSFLIVESGGAQTVVSLNWPDASARADLSHLVDAEVSVEGVFMVQGCGGRQYMGRNVLIDSTNSISTVRAAPSDPFAAARPLDLAWPADVDAASDGHRRSAVGTVVAHWMERNFILRTDDGNPVTVKLARGQPLPKTNTRVEAAGFVRQTPFVMKLANSLWRKADGVPNGEPAVDVEARHLFANEQGDPVVNIRHHGRPIRINGTVTDVLSRDSPSQILSLNCGGNPILAVAENIPAPAIGSVVEATGVCIANESHDADDITRLSGLAIVLRDATDFRVLRSPPWWTPGRLLVVIGVLVASVAAGALWVVWLRRLVERRSRELLKEQIAHTESELRIGERTRLAVELHDSLSQSLAALSFQISSARTAKAEGMDAAESMHLATAEKMLDSSRAELRHCLWDLRSDMLEERDFSTAISKTLRADAADAEIEIDFAIARSKMNDSTAHATLMIIRELVSNAIQHGNARHIKVSGRANGGHFVFSVADDGRGFDVDNYPGLHEGHFGLAGVRQRVSNLGGAFTIVSANGKGTTATVALKLPKHNEQARP